MQYHIKQKTVTFCVWAESYQEAATKAVKKLYPRVRGLVALRVTGDQEKSGMFQGYVPLKTGGHTSHGNNFHVM